MFKLFSLFISKQALICFQFTLPSSVIILFSLYSVDHGNKIITDEGIVDWKHIEACFKIKKENNLNMNPKNTEQHFHLPKFEGKIKVSHASQVSINFMS